MNKKAGEQNKHENIEAEKRYNPKIHKRTAPRRDIGVLRHKDSENKRSRKHGAAGRRNRRLEHGLHIPARRRHISAF